MNSKHPIYFSGLLFATLIAFQNCDRVQSDVQFLSGSETKLSNESDNGQHYDGKLFVLIGSLCPDGTQVQSRIRLTSASSAELLRKDCQDIAPVLLAQADFQINSTNSNELVYQNQIFTATVGFTAPPLVKPVSPLSFGAKCDGVTDDTIAFQAAINAGDVLVPAGTCVIEKTLFIQTSNKHFECEPGAILSHPDPYAGKMIHITAAPGNSITDVSILNCYFQGSNTVAPQYSTDGRQNDSAIAVNLQVNNLLIAGNTFDRFFGDAAVQTYSPTAAGTGRGYQIVHNKFKSCGRYGALFNGTIEGNIGYNTAVDCSLGISNDNISQATGGNVVEYNKITSVYGVGAAGISTSSAWLTGGLVTNGDFSTNLVRYNQVSGISSVSGLSGAAKPSQIIEKSNPGTLPAQYIGNTCTEGCVVVHF